MILLDASAVLKFLKKEKGFEKVKRLFKDALKEKKSLFIYHVNFIEILYVLNKKVGRRKALETIGKLKSDLLGVCNLGEEDCSVYAAYLKAKYGLSLGDSCGLAFTKFMGGRFYSADKALQKIAKEEEIDFELI